MEHSSLLQRKVIDNPNGVLFDISEKRLNQIDKRLPYFIPVIENEDKKGEQWSDKNSFLGKICTEYENAGWEIAFFHTNEPSMPEVALHFYAKRHDAFKVIGKKNSPYQMF